MPPKNTLALTEEAIEAIGEGMIAMNLPKAEWTNAGHVVALAWILLRRPDIDAERDMPELIRRYNRATGVKNTETTGYHETITQASIKLARVVLAQAPPTLAAAASALLASPLGNRDWLLHHWERETLFSPRARLNWVEPDRAPLPISISGFQP
jgi:hypothetical protein